MNRALDWWKEVPGTSDEVSPQLQAKSSPKGKKKCINICLDIEFVEDGTSHLVCDGWIK